MPDIQLSDTERKILSYLSRGASKETAVQRMSAFFSISANDITGALNNLKRQNLIIESKGMGASGVVALTANPLKVKPAMIDQSVVALLREAEAGGKAAGFKKKTFTADPDTGEIKDANAVRRVSNTPGPRPDKTESTKKGVDLGFDIDE